MDLALPTRTSRRHRHAGALMGSALAICLSFATITPASAATGDDLNYENPGDGHRHQCTQTDGSSYDGHVADNDLESASSTADAAGYVDWSGTRDSVVVSMRFGGTTWNTVSSGGRTYVAYALPTPPANWVLRERITSGLQSGFQYVRYQDGQQNVFRYELQIWVGGNVYRRIYAGNLTEYQRDRINAFRAAVQNMRAAALAMGQAGAAGTTVFGLGMSALRYAGSEAASVMGACAAVVSGLVYIGNRWIAFTTARSNAYAAWDDLLAT